MSHLSPERFVSTAFNFFPGDHDGQAFGFAGADDFAQIANFAPEHMAIEKQQGEKRLVLCRGADLLLNGQIGQKGVDFRFGHFGGMAHLVKEDVPLDPVAIGLFRAAAVVTGPQCFAHLVKQLRWAGETRWAIHRCPCQLPGLEPLIEFPRIEPPLPSDLVGG